MKQEEIQKMIDLLLAEAEIESSALSKWEKDFVKSVAEQFEQRNFVSEKQRSFLFDIYLKMKFS